MIREISNFFKVDGYSVLTLRHSHTILRGDYPKAYDEIKSVLEKFELAQKDFTDSGGGLAKLTQRLRDSLVENGWDKKNVKTQTITDEIETYSESHEIDHFKYFENGAIGLEIEWNNKPTFFDRDLSNFRFLHKVNIISLGVIICRGSSIQNIVFEIFKNVYSKNGIDALKDSITEKQRKRIENLIKSGKSEIDSFAKVLSTDKYGSSTTHMGTLIKSVERGIADPCPLLLIGIEKDRIMDFE